MSHEQLESSCPLHERSALYLFQYQVFRGLGETKLGQRSLISAWQEATTVHEKVVFGSWLRYEKQGEEVIADLLSSCGKYSEEFVPLDITSYSPVMSAASSSSSTEAASLLHISKHVVFKIGEERVELMDFALEETSPILSASCLQVVLYEMPDSLMDERVVEALTHKVSTIVVKASFSLYSCLSEVSMRLDPRSDRTLAFLERVVDFAKTDQQRALGFHRLGCTRLLRKVYRGAEEAFETAFKLGHVYSPPLEWMYQERSLYCEGDKKKLEDLDKATELDPTLTYPYMYRAVMLMLEQNAEAALVEINRILVFKLAVECLEIRFCLYLAMDDYEAALRDIQAVLTLCPDYRMFDGKVAARQLRTLVYEHVENWTTADCWMQLYEKWCNVDDIGSLSVIYQMLVKVFFTLGNLCFSLG